MSDRGAVPDARPSGRRPARVDGFSIRPTISWHSKRAYGRDEGQRTELDQGKVVGVQKGQTTAMSVSTSALAVILTSSVSNEAIDDMAPKMAMMQSPSSKLRHAEL